eukprot:NODE_11639_length_1274_cov_3.953793.p1 GENE.NODE_11639_length_1274_cov_3.953793~~NODE_11639_length_1274_cov_3.953793.p1  ORF type:complete len:212 (+),score=61.65 NODE_11639_length_1274_cov_3.953793:226-861(+)
MCAPPPPRLFEFGDLATMLLLETRLTARTEQHANAQETELTRLASNQTMPPPLPRNWPGSKFEKDVLKVLREVETAIHDPSAQLLGQEQLAWIEDELVASSAAGTRWRLLAQAQVLQSVGSPDILRALSPVTMAALEYGWAFLPPFIIAYLANGYYQGPFGVDSWEGYRSERERFLAVLNSASTHATTLADAGDLHMNLVGEVRTAAGLRV